MNLEDVPEGHGEKLHQDVALMKGIYNGKRSEVVLADFCSFENWI
jgi:hypothetical protein